MDYPQTASWADYDLDGNLDLFIGNEDAGASPHLSAFRNDGDRFVMLQPSQVSNRKFTKRVIWGDYDGDRYLIYAIQHGW